MVVVNLYNDHLLQPESNHRARSAEEIWYEVRENPSRFTRAAKAVGLTDAELREFTNGLLVGNYVHVRLPNRFDAMSGMHRGHVYAIRNAVLHASGAGWPLGYRVRLADGTEVFVPDICGNISVIRPPRVAYVPPVPRPRARYTQALAGTPVDQPVTIDEPIVEPPPTIAEAVPPASHVCGWWCFAVPVLGVIPAFVHGSSSTPQPAAAPPCAQGSNAIFACQK